MTFASASAGSGKDFYVNFHCKYVYIEPRCSASHDTSGDARLKAGSHWDKDGPAEPDACASLGTDTGHH
ncbi:hypothetical protein EVAR_75750_1 [Eumeta japonica]|uniref:Uncharacterized protein n=1 Tax=Eumeta variegata TaxID=151549 RepID=A0A4C1TDL7_EUMVA|nr:hypothetical protein EVAR_75750_1 [Eumeta japonica]